MAQEIISGNISLENDRSLVGRDIDAAISDVVPMPNFLSLLTIDFLKIILGGILCLLFVFWVDNRTCSKLLVNTLQPRCRITLFSLC